jgi:hypothetical protein
LADIKAFANKVPSGKTVIFSLQKSIKHLSLLKHFGKTRFQIKPLLSAKTLCSMRPVKIPKTLLLQTTIFLHSKKIRADKEQGFIETVEET